MTLSRNGAAPRTRVQWKWAEARDAIAVTRACLGGDVTWGGIRIVVLGPFRNAPGRTQTLPATAWSLARERFGEVPFDRRDAQTLGPLLAPETLPAPAGWFPDLTEPGATALDAEAEVGVRAALDDAKLEHRVVFLGRIADALVVRLALPEATSLGTAEEAAVPGAYRAARALQPLAATWGWLRFEFLARYCDADGRAEMRPHLVLMITGERLARLHLDNLTPEATYARFLPEEPKNAGWTPCPTK